MRLKAIIYQPAISIMIALSMIFVAPGLVHASDTFPSELSISGQKLVKQGEGTRKKAFISLYNAALYVGSAGTSAQSIIDADEPMAIRLSIVSGFISSKKMKQAMNDGFELSTGGNTAALKEKIDTFATGFSDEIEKKDLFDIVYIPGTGVQVLKDGNEQVVVEGLPFKKALFAIWLGEKPVQKSLKTGLMGEGK